MVDRDMQMADNNSTSVNGEGRLADIVRKVKIAAAEREDVVVDIREADRARLELLAEELRPFLEDVPREIDLFDFTISSGLRPRFWVDAVAHVHMAQDRRTYRFVRDTRLGRVVIAEESEIARAAEAVSRYIGERLIERERSLAGDVEDVRRRDAHPSPEAGQAQGENLPAMTPPDGRRSGGAFIVGLLWFILGCVAGAGFVASAFWDRLGGLIR